MMVRKGRALVGSEGSVVYGRRRVDPSGRVRRGRGGGGGSGRIGGVGAAEWRRSLMVSEVVMVEGEVWSDKVTFKR